MTAIADLPVVERLQFILGSLRTFAGARGFFVFGHNVVLMCVFVNGLTRRAQRFARLVAAIEAGTLRPLPRAERSGPSLRRPSRFDWLRRRLQQGMGSLFDAWNFANHILIFEALLADPELRRLYDLAPDRMGRLLRQVCRTLGLKQPDFLRRPVRKRARRKPEGNRPRAPRRRAAIGEHRPAPKPPSPP
ncbi:MAG: hypothetical protein JOY70_10050 [Acidisphaera sp.]|nr:hypothetical protein [Acidisphaera sp.]MBV9811878.1 hypothetical protein [Acetobacteraceae bacterium]